MKVYYRYDVKVDNSKNKCRNLRIFNFFKYYLIILFFIVLQKQYSIGTYYVM